MNDRVCNHCDGRITDGMDVKWNGGEFHPGCVGEAVLQHRAKIEIPSVESDLPDDYFNRMEGEDIEYQDDIDEFEEDFADAIERFDAIEPEVMPSDFQPTGEIPINFPAGSVMVAPRAIIHPPTNGTLIAHCGANKVSRGNLLELPLPEETDTFKPISHYFLVQAIEEALSFRHISITKEEFAVTPDGMKFFAVLQVNAQYEGVNFAIGLRNSNDKSMRLGIVAGYKVTVCDNLSFAGEYKPMLAKHSKNLDLIESVSTAVDRLQRGWKPIREMIDFKRQHQLTDGKARDMLYQLFTSAKLPISLFRSTHKEFFIDPSYDEFRPKTLWSLENAVTTSIKKLNPISQYENTAKLGKFINDYTASF
jgi:hypothetical protein